MDLDFLNDGETLTVTYTVVVNDGDADSNTEEVEFTITGTNDVPTLDAITGGTAAEATDASAQAVSIAGSITTTDLDNGDTLTPTAAGVLATGGVTVPTAVATALVAPTALTFSPATATSDGTGQTLNYT